MLNPKTNQQIIKAEQEQLDTMRRNEAIAQLMGFKQYLPSSDIKTAHEKQYLIAPIQWFFVPGIGRYNSFELKFNSDWNWLISAVIEMKKYMRTHTKNPFPGKETVLDRIYWKIQNICPMEFDLKELWILVSDYALEIRRIKNKENKLQPPVRNSNEWYEILYPGKDVAVMDPNGWDSNNWQFSWYEELITEEEFNDRLKKSTLFRERNGI